MGGVLPHPFDPAPYVPRPLALAQALPAETDPDLEQALTDQERELIRTLRPEAAVPFIVTGGSALFSFALYAGVSNPTIACGLLLGMWAHELGHRAVLARLGIPASPIVFVPFVGAVQRLFAQPASERHGAWMALAGPACGLLFAIACELLHVLTRDPDLRLLAVAHALLTLLDLLPFPPLDGDRVRRALALRFDRSIALAYALLIAAPFLLI